MHVVYFLLASIWIQLVQGGVLKPKAAELGLRKRSDPIIHGLLILRGYQDTFLQSVHRDTYIYTFQKPKCECEKRLEVSHPQSFRWREQPEFFG